MKKFMALILFTITATGCMSQAELKAQARETIAEAIRKPESEEPMRGHNHWLGFLSYDCPQCGNVLRQAILDVAGVSSR